MTRKEEIQQAARLYSPDNAYEAAWVFQYGAEWADKTMIEKACKWLENYFIEEEIPHYENFIINFRKALEE